MEFDDVLLESNEIDSVERRKENIGAVDYAEHAVAFIVSSLVKHHFNYCRH